LRHIYHFFELLPDQQPVKPEAENGTQALEFYRQHKPDVVTTDYKLVSQKHLRQAWSRRPGAGHHDRRPARDHPPGCLMPLPSVDVVDYLTGWQGK
jgi:hypothetical protein